MPSSVVYPALPASPVIDALQAPCDALQAPYGALQAPYGALQAPCDALPQLPEHIEKYSPEWLQWLMQNDFTPWGIASHGRRIKLLIETKNGCSLETLLYKMPDDPSLLNKEQFITIINYLRSSFVPGYYKANSKLRALLNDSPFWESIEDCTEDYCDTGCVDSLEITCGTKTFNENTCVVYRCIHFKEAMFNCANCGIYYEEGDWRNSLCCECDDDPDWCNN